MYTVTRFITHSKEFAANQRKRQSFNPSSLPYKFELIFMRIKQKKTIFFEEKKFKMADFSKCPFFKITNSRKKIVKISHIGP